MQMKILMSDKYFFIKGGAERYMFELMSILQKRGHEIIPFSMQHPNNFETEYEQFFVKNIEYNLSGSIQKVKASLSFIPKMIYSFDAKNQIKKLIEYNKPDIAHLHMIDHQISPSILPVLKEYKIPVIQTVHQYKLVCPNYRLYNPSTNQVCEKCLDGHYIHPVFEKCHKNSTSAGFLLWLEMFFHKKMQIYEKNIDLFHVPSHFMGSMLKRGGINPDKVSHLFYTIDLNEYSPSFDFEDYFIYFGRLAPEKGILTLLKAMEDVHKSNLLIVGDGPEEDTLKQFAHDKQLKNVKFIGLKNGNELKQIIANAKFSIVPSEWYDNSPLVIYESLALGTPVIGSVMGGIPELIRHEETGYHFTAKKPSELAERMNFLLENPKTIKKMSRNARQHAEKYFSPDYHYDKILEYYDSLSTSI